MKGLRRYPAGWLGRLALQRGLFAVAFSLLTAAPVLRGQAPSAAAENDYRAFIAQMIAPKNVADCIAKMDGVIAEQESASGDNTRSAPTMGADTAVGLHMEYAVIRTPEASMFYFTVSRGGQDFRFSDATRIVALFCDRVGLPHPVAIKEGEKPFFYAQWLIKPSDWKEMMKMMKKVRAENRAEKDLSKAFGNAIRRELLARQLGTPGSP